MLSISRTSAVSSVRDNTSFDALGAAALKGLEKVPEYQETPQLFKDLMRPYFGSLTGNLSVPADVKVDVTAVLKVTYAYIAWIQQNRVFEQVRDAFPVGSVERLGMELAIELYANLEAQLAEVLKDVPGTLKKQGVTERQVLAGRLSPAMMARYDAGNLSIKDLCTLEPRDLFVLNDDKPKMQRAKVA